jgi:hypothetical protein
VSGFKGISAYPSGNCTSQVCIRQKRACYPALKLSVRLL